MLDDFLVRALLAHGGLAVGLVTLAFFPNIRVDLQALLFGDILAVSRTDLAVIWGGGALVLLGRIWRPLLATIVDPDLATVAGLQPERTRLIFGLLMAAVIALAINYGRPPYEIQSKSSRVRSRSSPDILRLANAKPNQTNDAVLDHHAPEVERAKLVRIPLLASAATAPCRSPSLFRNRPASILGRNVAVRVSGTRSPSDRRAASSGP